MIQLLANDLRGIWKLIIGYSIVLVGISIFINGNIALIATILMITRLIMTSSYNNDSSNVMIWNAKFITHRYTLVIEKYLLFFIIFGIANGILLLSDYLFDTSSSIIEIEMNSNLVLLSFLVSSILISIYLTNFFMYGSIKAFNDFKLISLSMGIIYIAAIKILPELGVDFGKIVSSLFRYDLKTTALMITISILIVLISFLVSLFFYKQKDL